MDLIIKEHDIASREMYVDIAKFDYDEKNLLIEFAKVVSLSDDGEELKEIEVRSKIKLPIECALPLLVKYVRTLVEYEIDFRNGYGLSMSDHSEEEVE